jgi:hypothetical protein
MAKKTLNIKINGNEIYDINRLTANIEDASSEESSEILDMLNNMSDDDLTITSSKQFQV